MLNRWIILWLLSGCCNFSIAATTFFTVHGYQYDTLQLNRVVRTIKKSENSIPKIAAIIESVSTTDQEKAYCIYYYIASQYKYDLNRSKQITKGKIKRELYPNELLKKHKGVCGDFANLTKLLCDQLGIPCFRVSGYAKTFRVLHPVRRKKTDHAWNVLRINGRWYPFDVTWGIWQYSEKKYNKKGIDYAYFLAELPFFSKKHHPLDPIFQLRDKQVSYGDFRWGRKAVKQHVLDVYIPDSLLNQRYRLSRKEQVMAEYFSSATYLKRAQKTAASHVEMEIRTLTDSKNPMIAKNRLSNLKISADWYHMFAETARKLNGRISRRIARYAQYMETKQQQAIEKLERKKIK